MFAFIIVTLDYKALIMLLKRKDDDADENVDGLCGRGLDTECCVYCKVIRVGYHMILTAIGLSLYLNKAPIIYKSFDNGVIYFKVY